jgi:hypothetical protein
MAREPSVGYLGCAQKGQRSTHRAVDVVLHRRETTLGAVAPLPPPLPLTTKPILFILNPTLGAALERRIEKAPSFARVQHAGPVREQTLVGLRHQGEERGSANRRGEFKPPGRIEQTCHRLRLNRSPRSIAGTKG